ncbi:MAG: sodium-dependent transporter [Gammaproteobacteria bacterium]|nr:sodium-dependent transporter [Pseudomonadales bacterium]MCP5347089.1 sodium-dependent transporter [Pseudomonadales bacterium]
MVEDRGQFSSRLGFVLAAAGSAVGLGNLVAFPVMASKNGGAAFLFVYIAFVALICYPVMLAEIAMGRRSQRNPVGAFTSIPGGGGIWRWAGKLAILTPFMIAVFYTVITVWIVMYLVYALTGNLDYLSEPGTFGEVTTSTSLFVYLPLLLAVIFYILLGGVRNGIERLARILMPALAVMLILLVVFVLTLDNASAGIAYYLVPDFSKINGSVINGALSQAFFSLSLGMGILITYGSYFSREDNIPQSTRMVAIADTAIAFFAGMLILPAIFAFDPNTNTDDLSTSSVGLIFSFLPQIFLSMQSAVGYTGACVVAAVFFTLVFFAALTSLVSIIEIPIAYMVDEWEMSRRRAVFTQAALLTLFAVPATLSLGLVDFLTSFTSYGGAVKSFFDVISDVFYETILPFVGLLVCLFCAYRWKMSGLSEELSVGDAAYAGSRLEKYLNVSLGTVIPLILLLVFINTVATKYFAISLFGF